MTSDIQQNRYDQTVRRVCGLIGPGSKVAEALTELFPVIDVERVPGELLLLGGTALCFGGAGVTGAAGERPRIQLFNPVNSGKIISVSSVVINSTAVIIIRATVGTIALTNGVGTERFRDTRLGGVARPAGQIRTDSTVAITDATLQFRTVANTPFFFDDENTVAVLAPGSGLEFGSFSVATTIEGNFFWRERVAEESELLFP